MNFDQSNEYKNDYTYQSNDPDYEANYNKNAPLITSSSRDFWGEEDRKPAGGQRPKRGDGNLPSLKDVKNAAKNATKNATEHLGGLLPKGSSERPPRRRRRKLKRPNLGPVFRKIAGIRQKGRQNAPGAGGKSSRKKRTPQAAAIISGLICSSIVLLTEVGIWGLYCFSRGLPGDTNVNASTFMYCFAVFAGCFWAGAVVKRRSLRPVLVICGVFLGLSLLVSLQLFSLAEFKAGMILLKLLFTIIAAMLGFVLSLAPYLINKALKQKRQQRRQPQRSQNSRNI